MNGPQLRALGAADLRSLHADCGLGGRPEATREQLVAELVAWQQRKAPQAPQAGRRPATPMQVPRVRGQACPACSCCGRPPVEGLCACGFLQMDPLRPVAEILAHVVLSAAASRARPGAGRAAVDLRVPCLAEGEGLELRMVRSGSPLRHAWPRALQLSVGGAQVLSVEAPREPATQGARGDWPFQLGEALLPAPGSILALRAEADCGEHQASKFHLCVARVARRRSAQELAEECASRAPLTAACAAELLARARRAEASDDLCSSPWEVPLRCPLTHERMGTPARGRLCGHLQCFELEAYLTLSSRASFHRRWRCPVCDQHLPPSELAVCSFTAGLLRETDACAAPIEAALEAAGQAASAARAPRRSRRRWRRGALRSDAGRETAGAGGDPGAKVPRRCFRGLASCVSEVALEC